VEGEESALEEEARAPVEVLAEARAPVEGEQALPEGLAQSVGLRVVSEVTNRYMPTVRGIEVLTSARITGLLTLLRSGLCL